MSSKLSKECFWRNAFDKGAPFYKSYIKYFKEGVVSGIPEIIDIHREAIYYIKDHALGPIIIRLIQIAAKYPESSFIETLAFFLSSDQQQEKLIAAVSGLERQSIKELTEGIISLTSYLASTNDNDLVGQLLKFQKIISTVSQG